MRITLRPVLACLALALLATAPVLAQDDHPNGIGAATDAFGQTSISGMLETTSDVDCFAIYINDAANFSATSNGSSVPDPGLDSKLYLWNGSTAGATSGIAYNDDDQVGGTLLSRLPAGNALYSSLASGSYVLCVTSYDNDPFNAGGVQIFPQGSPFNQVYPPNPSNGDPVLASWLNPGFGDSGPYTIELTGVGSPSGDCDLDFSATLNTTTVPPGGTLTFNVTVQNTTGNPVPASLQLVATGPVSRTLNLGSGTIPGGATVSRSINVRVPSNAPSGSYTLDLNLSANGEPCDSEQFTVTVTGASRVVSLDALKVEDYAAARAAAEAAATRNAEVAFEVISGDFFAAEAATAVVGVAPNPFVGQAAITFEVAEAAQARLAVYDVLGREVAVLVDGRVEAGLHTATFDAQGLAAGTYVYRLSVGGAVQTGRMTLAH